MKKIFQWFGGCGLFILTGCASLPNEYRPRTMGALNDSQTNNGLSIQLAAKDSVAPMGKPVVFRVVVRNVGERSFWLPRKPQQGFFWTYPNGRHDCYFFDREQALFFGKNECVLLQPGQELELSGMVETSYFDHPGITEFKAEVAVARNTNPALAPFWSGRAFSNSFGIQLLPGTRHGIVTRASAALGTHESTPAKL